MGGGAMLMDEWVDLAELSNKDLRCNLISIVAGFDSKPRSNALLTKSKAKVHL